MVKVTIGLPYYNNEATLADALKSVLIQSFTDWELILLDDGSNDQSFRIAESVGDSRIIHIRDRLNRGLPARLNQISHVATGKYLARMDADDMMHPERLRKQVDLLDGRPEVDVVGTGMYSINSEKSLEGLRFPADQNSLRSPAGIFSVSPFIHSSIMGRTRWFQANPYTEKLRRAQDRELWIRTFSSSTFINIREPLMFVRESGQVTARKYASNMESNRLIIGMHSRELGGRRQMLELIARTYFKQGLYVALERIGALNSLVQRRNRSLSDSELADAVRVLSIIDATLLG